MSKKVNLVFIILLSFFNIAISAENNTAKANSLTTKAEKILTEKNMIDYMDIVQSEYKKGNISSGSITVKNLEKYTSVEKIKQAIALYEEAYKLGNTAAAKKIAAIYIIIFLDRNNAKKWYHKMIEKGDVSGYSALAAIEQDFEQHMHYINEGIKHKDEGSAHIIATFAYPDKDRFNQAYKQFFSICSTKQCNNKFIADMEKMHKNINTNH